MIPSRLLLWRIKPENHQGNKKWYEIYSKLVGQLPSRKKREAKPEVGTFGERESGISFIDITEDQCSTFNFYFAYAYSISVLLMILS